MSNHKIKKNQVIIISDLHLSEHSPELTCAFYAFLKNTAHDAKRLIILGDFFETWLGDDMADTHAMAVAANLKQLSDSGTEIAFMGGNRDFALSKTYAAHCGMQLLPEFYVLENEILLCHGDQLCTLDTAYQKWRRLIRQSWLLWILRRSPKCLRTQIGKKARLKSLAIKRASQQIFTQELEEKQSLKATQFEKYDVTESAVTDVLRRYQVDMIIHGHTHKALDSDRRYVLRDWGEKYDYFCIDLDVKPLVVKRYIVEI